MRTANLVAAEVGLFEAVPRVAMVEHGMYLTVDQWRVKFSAALWSALVELQH